MTLQEIKTNLRAVVRPDSETVSVEYAAAQLGIGRTTLYGAIKRGEVPVLRIGRRIVVRRVTIARLLADGRTGSDVA